MSTFRGGGLHPIYLYSPKSVQRALAIACPVCRELPGTACKVEEGKPVVHDARESLAYHGRKIWT
jgi:hypothetical protein